MVDRLDEARRRVPESHSDGFDLAKPLDAFPVVRRSDSDRGPAGPAALEIFDRSPARLPDVAHLERPPGFLRDSSLRDVALAKRRVLEQSLPEQCPAWLQLDARSSDVRWDVQPPQVAWTERLQGAPDRQPEEQPQALPSYRLALAMEQPVPPALREEASVLVLQASVVLWLEPEMAQGARSSLWLPQP